VDGIVLLKEDHKTVEKLFKQFEKAGDDAHRQHLPGQSTARLRAVPAVPTARGDLPDSSGFNGLSTC
jgi:hypothetical protein